MYAFLFFRKNLEIYKFEGANFSCDNSFLQFQPKNNQMRHFPITYGFLFFGKALEIYKFESADFKYDNSALFGYFWAGIVKNTIPAQK